VTLDKDPAEELKAIREGLGLNQGDFADLLLIDRSYYNRVERGKKSPSNRLLESAKRLKGAPDMARRLLTEEQEGAVNEGRTGYGEKEALRILKGFEPMGSGRRGPSKMGEVIDHLTPWFEASSESEDVAPYLLVQLRKNLPHEDLNLFREKEEDKK
jgi:transcriptional regulator with XRE-family HTH domain